MSAMQRNKGKTGEREAAELVRLHTGWDVRRRVRQHEGDSDLVGVPGWSVEIKRCRTALPGEVTSWWAQAVAQGDGALPVLLYRADRAEWRAVWPLAVLLGSQRADYWRGIEWTATTTVQAWAAVARELAQTEAGFSAAVPMTRSTASTSSTPTHRDSLARAYKHGSLAP